MSGIWHGANWTFVAWGLLNAVFVILAVAFSKNKKHKEIVAYGKSVPTIKEATQILSTFILTSFAWIFFRADSIGEAIRYIYHIFDWSLFMIPDLGFRQLGTILIIIIFVIIEWMGRQDQYAIEKFGVNGSRAMRWGFYYGLIIVIFFLQGVSQEFIYFQF